MKNALLTSPMSVALSILLSICLVRPAFADDTENIAACAQASKDFSGLELNQFDVSYEGNIFDYSIARWSDVYCKVKFGQVHTIQVDGKAYIYRGYAGIESFELNSALELKTDEAIRQLKTRISLLEARASQVSDRLKKKNPDHNALTQFVDDGILMALGSSTETPSGLAKAPSVSLFDISNASLVKQAGLKDSSVDKKPSQSKKANSQKTESSARAKSADDQGKKMMWMERGKDAVREKLKDSRSAEFRSVFFRRGSDGVPMTCGEVNSKNGFGGLTGFQKFVSAGQADMTFLEEEISDFYKVWNRFCVR